MNCLFHDTEHLGAPSAILAHRLRFHHCVVDDSRQQEDAEEEQGHDDLGSMNPALDRDVARTAVGAGSLE